MVDSVNVNVRAGEVVGIAGLMGAGRTEFAMSLFGRTYGREITGRVLMYGREVSTATVSDAIRAGIAYATEDRKYYGRSEEHTSELQSRGHIVCRLLLEKT